MKFNDVVVLFFAVLLVAGAVFGGADLVQAQSSSTCCTEEEWALIGVNATDIAYAFGWGFAAVVLCWFFGFIIGVAIDTISKL